MESCFKRKTVKEQKELKYISSLNSITQFDILLLANANVSNQRKI